MIIMNDSITDRINGVKGLKEEAERLFEGRPRQGPIDRKIVKGLRAAGFTKSKSRMGMSTGGGAYTNPQGDIFSKDIQKPKDVVAYWSNPSARPDPDPEKIQAAEKQVRKIASQVGVTEKQNVGRRVALSEPGGHPKIWYHWTDGTFYVDVDYTTDY